MLKVAILLLALIALVNAQVRVTRLFGPDPQCRSNFALGVVIATIPNCIPSNCTASVQSGFYEIVECAQTLDAVTVPPYWLTLSTYGANDTCNINSRTSIIGARNGQCFPALSGFVSFSCTSGQITSQYCTASCDDSDCVSSEVNTQCEQSNLFGGIFANSQCPTQPEPPMAPIALDLPPTPVDSPLDSPVATNSPTPSIYIPISAPSADEATSSAATISASLFSLGFVALYLF